MISLLTAFSKKSTEDRFFPMPSKRYIFILIFSLERFSSLFRFPLHHPLERSSAVYRIRDGKGPADPCAVAVNSIDCHYERTFAPSHFVNPHAP